MRIDWRMVVLTALFLGPFAIFVGLGWAWVAERGWALPAFLLWSLAGVFFGILSARWTRTRRPILTPLDWSAPHTFAPRDREAWNLVLAAAERTEQATSDDLVNPEVYFHVATNLADELAHFYHPRSTDPIEYVPVVDLLTAIELASEDLGRMIREIPGGDLVTLAHWKTAVNAASLVSRANEFYNYLLPLVQPLQGAVRLGTSKLVAQPAWKNMRENVLRWFFRAYIQRLGVHMIEMYSGRLAIGAAGYRRLTRRGGPAAAAATESPLTRPLRIAVAGAQGAGKSRLAADLRQARDAALNAGAGARPAALDPSLVPLLRNAEFVETPGYPASASRIPFRDQFAQRAALDAATRADMLLLLVDAARDDVHAEVRLLQDWSDHFTRETHLEAPPALVILAAYGSAPDQAGPVLSPGEARARREALHQALPSGMVAEVVTVGLERDPAADVQRRVLPAVTALLYRAERAAIIRDLHLYASRSKIGRVAEQLGRHGRRAWEGVRGEAARRFPFRRRHDERDVTPDPAPAPDGPADATPRTRP